MKALLFDSAATYLSPRSPKSIFGNGFMRNQNSCLIIGNGYSSSSGWPFSAQNLSIGLRKSVFVEAKKEKKNKKEDTHSFIPKPDEATGPFPESVLLKEKKVQEDGKLLPEFADPEEQELFETLNLILQSDLNEERVRHYEVVYLIHEKHADEVGSVNEKVQDFLSEKKGKVWRLNDWGLRRLAYKINKAKNAHYILMNFELEAKWINDFKSMLDKDERVIRHLVIKRDEAITEDCPPPPEFHTLRADMDDYDDEEDEMDYDDAYDDEEDDIENDIIVVNSDDDDGMEVRNCKSASIGSMGGKNLRAEKVSELRK